MQRSKEAGGAAFSTLGLVPKAGRTLSGYRQSSEKEVHVLRFIARARDLGFSIPQIGELLSLWHDHRRASGKMKALALKRVEVLDGKVRELLEMKAALQYLAASCHGEHRPDGPILEDLATATHAAPPTSKPAKRTGRLSGLH
jgi:DNA-binding transcriptional MerR regulator